MQSVTNTATGEVTTFTYDGDGRRVVRETVTDTIVYVGPHYEVRFEEGEMPEDLDGDCLVTVVDIMRVAARWNCQCGDECYEPLYDLDGDCDIDVVDIMKVAARWRETCEQLAEVVKYYYANGRRVAMGENGTLYWLLTDHLGSTAITAYSGGGKKAEIRYKAWGEDRYTSGTTPTTYRFTGQRWDDTIELYFYNARYYDPVLGRFISADPLVPNPANPQDLNRYSYVRNNPLRYTDPTGHYILLEEGFGVRITDEGRIQIVLGGSRFPNPVEVALANAILSDDPRYLEAIPPDIPAWAIERSLANVLSELGYLGGWPVEEDLLLDPFFVFGLVFGILKGVEGGEALPAEGLPAGERLDYTETIWDAAARGPYAIGRWGEKLVGQRLPVKIEQQRVLRGQRVYDGYVLSTGQFVEIKTTARDSLSKSSHSGTDRL